MDEEKNPSIKNQHLVMSLLVLVGVVLTGIIVYMMGTFEKDIPMQEEAASVVESPKQSISEAVLNKQIGSISDLDFPVSSNVNTFRTQSRLPLQFNLPEGFGFFHSEGFEGVYEGSLNFGKEVKSEYLFHAGVDISFVSHPGVKDPESIINWIAQEYYESEYGMFAFVELFGNKAVVYTGDSQRVVGYLREDQLPEGLGGGPMIITIYNGVYGLGVEEEPELFGTLLNSLSVVKE